MDQPGLKAPRVIIIGAGPAGIRCAEKLLAAGIRPTLIEEGQRDGGQIYRRQPPNFKRPYSALYGTEAGKAENLHQSFDHIREQIDYRPGTLVWNIADSTCHTVSNGKQDALPFDALVLSTGATDRLMPLQGWNLAGTFSLGGSQVALKSQACAVGERVVFVGTGALLYLVSAQYVKAGAKVAAVLDTSTLSARIKALPNLLAQPAVLWKGVQLTMALKRAGVQVLNGVEPRRIVGDSETGVEAIEFKDVGGRSRSIECDAVAMGYHLRPETQLADLARCEFYFDTYTRQWLPRIDSDGRSSVPGVYLAGDGTRVLGADAAETSGKLAALAVLQDLGGAVDTDEANTLRQRLGKLAQFARGLSQAFPWPVQQAANLPDETIVCRCEAISAGELRSSVDQAGACESNRAKAFTRVGMGRCQGRYCGNAAAEIIAERAQIPVEKVGRLRGQAPVKPMPIAYEVASHE